MNKNYIMPQITEKNEGHKFSDDKMQVLFGSKTRVRLLKLFLANPNESYYVRELTRVVGAQINAIRRELANLMGLGIVKINENKNIEQDLDDLKSGKVIRQGIRGVERKYYQLNKDFVLYNELRNLFAKMKGLSREAFIEKVQDLGDITLFLLSGLFIKDDSSEVDVLVVGNIPREKMQEVINEYNESVSREINYTLLSDDEFKYRQEVVDRFLYNILQNTNNIIVEDKRHVRFSEK